MRAFKPFEVVPLRPAESLPKISALLKIQMRSKIVHTFFWKRDVFYLHKSQSVFEMHSDVWNSTFQTSKGKRWKRVWKFKYYFLLVFFYRWNSIKREKVKFSKQYPYLGGSQVKFKYIQYMVCKRGGKYFLWKPIHPGHYALN